MGLSVAFSDAPKSSNQLDGSGEAPEAPLPLLRHEQHVLEPEQLPIAGPPADSSGLQRTAHQETPETPSHDAPWFFCFQLMAFSVIMSKYFMIVL